MWKEPYKSMDHGDLLYDEKGLPQVIVDTSVIIAILKDEQDAASIGAIWSRSRDCRMSAVSYVEAAVVVDSNQNPVLSRRFDDLLRDAEISVEPVTLNQARIAREAYRDFGKGRHRAGLNRPGGSVLRSAYC